MPLLSGVSWIILMCTAMRVSPSRPFTLWVQMLMGSAFLLQGFHCTGGVGYSTIAICGLLPLIMLGLHLMLLMGWVQFGFWVSDVDPIINLARYIGHGPRFHDHVLGLILDGILHSILSSGV